MDLVTRKWICELVSIEETSTQVQVVFMDALESEGLLELVEARQDTVPADTFPFDAAVDEPELPPILLAVSDNGPQMTSGSTREFMAMCAIAQHFGRPGTPTDQAWIESLFSHIKAEWPHLDRIRGPEVLRAELADVRRQYNTIRLHAGIGYVTPNDEHEGRGPRIRAAGKHGLRHARWARIAYHRIQQAKANRRSPSDVDWFAPRSVALTQKHRTLVAYGNSYSHELFSARMGCQTYGVYGIDLAALCNRQRTR